MIAAANDYSSQSHPITPKDKEFKKLELYIQKVYSTITLQMNRTNSRALLSKYYFNNYFAISKFADRLPEEYKEQFLALISEEHIIACTSLQAAMPLIQLCVL